MRTAIYAGSFDPVTLGHLDIIRRAARLTDRLVIGVLVNSGKKAAFTAEERVEQLKRVTADLPNVIVDSFSGLTVDFAKKWDAHILVRGLRAVTDFEYELQISQVNRKLDPELDSIFLTTSLEYAYLSSSVVKEIAGYGGDYSRMVPEEIMEDIKCKFK